MLVGNPLRVFVERSSASGTVGATLQRVFRPPVLDGNFQHHAGLGYTKEWNFCQCVRIVDSVVFQDARSVAACCETHREAIPATTGHAKIARSFHG